MNFAELNLAAFRQCAEELGALAGDVAEAKHELDALQAAALHYWKGKADDAFRDHMQPQKNATQLTSDACDTASALIDRFASDVAVYKAQWERARHEAEAQGFAFVGDLIIDPKPSPDPRRVLTMLGLQKDVMVAMARADAAEGELMQGLNSLNANADGARSLLKDKSGDGFLGAAKDAGEGVLREGTSVVLGLSTFGAYAVGAQKPPGFDRWPDAKKLVIGMVDGKEIEAAWKSGHPWKAGGMGAGVAASMFLGPGGKAGKAARAEAEAGTGLRGEARAGGRAATRKPLGPRSTETGGGSAAESPTDSAQVSEIVSHAARGKRDFGLGSATRAQAEAAGRAWVGDDARLSRNGKAWVSKDGLRQYRPPSYKGHRGYQANLESRATPTGDWQNNGHIDIEDMP